MHFEPMVHLMCTGSKRNAMGIYIDTPCSEDWSKMTPTEKGAFCQKCALEVHDFSGKTPLEIKKILVKEQSGSVCGRILPTTLAQMNSDFRAWERTNTRSFQSMLIFSLIVAFGFTLFSCNEEEKGEMGKIQTAGLSLIHQESAVISDETDSLQIDVQTIVETSKRVAPREVQEVLVEIQSSPELPEEHLKGAMRYDPIEFEEPEEMKIMMLGGMGFSPSFMEHIEEEVTQNNLEAEVEFSSKLFPNPAKNKTQMEVNLPKDIDAQVKLFNLAGEFVREIHSGLLTEGMQKIDVNLSGLTEGIYLVTLQSTDYSTSLKLRKY